MTPAVPLYAEDGAENEKKQAQLIGDHNYDPLGVLTPEEIKALEELNGSICKSESCELNDDTGKHFSLMQHRHWVTSIYFTGTTWSSRGVVAAGYNPYNNSMTLSYSKTHSTSNSWSASIGFDVGIVNGAVGFNATATGSSKAEIVVNVPAYNYCEIYLFDCYTVKQYNCMTQYLDEGYVIFTEYGTGSAWQWTNFVLSYSLS